MCRWGRLSILESDTNCRARKYLFYIGLAAEKIGDENRQAAWSRIARHYAVLAQQPLAREQVPGALGEFRLRSQQSFALEFLQVLLQAKSLAY